MKKLTPLFSRKGAVNEFSYSLFKLFFHLWGTDYTQTKTISNCSECNPNSVVNNGVEQKINELLKLFPDGSYFSQSGGP